MAATVEGVDVEGVTRWFREILPGVEPPLSFELAAGGRSNLTYRVTDAAGSAWVLRRPPLSHVLPTAHDMGREYRIISALGPTAVPVPKAYGYCDDEAVNGRPFYVMSYVEGHILRDPAVVEKTFAPAQRRVIGEDLVDVLAELHAVDVDAVGLGDLGRKEGYIARQLKRWYSQFQQSAALGGRSIPAVDEMHAFLSARIPAQGPATIVHGDYRLDNTMIGDDGRVAAVLDWEICTLGDPLADVGLLMVYWPEPGDEVVGLSTTPTAVEGFPTRVELTARYAERSGRDLSALDFYVAFGYWKLACILEGVYSRYMAGSGGGDRSGVDDMALQVERLAEASKEAASAVGA